MKAIKRENKSRNARQKRIKHGIGKWKGIDGISKAWKKILAKKIKGM